MDWMCESFKIWVGKAWEKRELKCVCLCAWKAGGYKEIAGDKSLKQNLLSLPFAPTSPVLLQWVRVQSKSGLSQFPPRSMHMFLTLIVKYIFFHIYAIYVCIYTYVCIYLHTYVHMHIFVFVFMIKLAQHTNTHLFRRIGVPRSCQNLIMHFLSQETCAYLQDNRQFLRREWSRWENGDKF